MPEYLAPGVFIEEVPSGVRPIEGVGTSAGAMVAAAERGPVDVPILVTSMGDYTRWFGGRIDPAAMIDPVDPDRWHGYLPYAVEQFFGNGGGRLWVVRVEGAAAARSRFTLHFEDTPNAPATRLLRSARVGSGSAALPPDIYVVEPAGLVANDRIRVGDGSLAEYRDIAAIGPAALHMTSDLPLSHAHDAALATVEAVNIALAGGVSNLVEDAPRGATRIIVGAGAPAVGDTVEIRDPGSAGRSEYRQIMAVQAVVAGDLLTLDSPLHFAHPAGDDVEPLNLGGAAGPINLSEDASGGDVAAFTAAAPLAGDLIVIDQGTPNQDVRRLGEITRLTFDQAAYADYPARSSIVGVTFADDATPARTLTAGAAVGATALSLDDRVGLNIGDVLRIGAVGVDAEYVTITDFGAARTPAPDAGVVIVDQPLRIARVTGDAAQSQLAPATGAEPPASLVFAAVAGEDEVDATQGATVGYAAGLAVRVTTPGGAVFFHTINQEQLLAPQPVTLANALLRSHDAGAVVARRATLLELEALDTGAWGDRLRISVEPFARGRVSRAEVTASPLVTQIVLSSLNEVHPGTVLELLDAVTGERIGDLIKVATADAAAGNLVTLDAPGMTIVQRTAILTAIGAGRPLEVRSIEFNLIVRLLQAPEPAVPSSARNVISEERYEGLSMDPRHPEYVERVIGAINGPLRDSDRRPEGNGVHIRVQDTATNLAAAQAIREMPEALVDIGLGGRQTLARHPLFGGVDGIPTDADYIGADSVDPELRTGLFATTLERANLIAFPGQTTPTLQQQLISHCERERYCFALLDGERGGMIADLSAQRDGLSSERAAMFAPWVQIARPFALTAGVIEPFALPPSGAMMGVFARVDTELGVHFAPANKTVRGIIGLDRYFTQGEQEVLNPSSINAIRRFPERGIRIFGARTLADNSQFRYTNVVRTTLFIEESIERGLQFAVFLPNSEDLWADVRQSVSSFLERLWRDGALEGARSEDAFFVRCDRTTMTQDDIDNGRLICLVGVAIVRPAEFVIFRISQKTGDS